MLHFEERKRDHISISLSPQSQTQAPCGLDRVELTHEALPEIDFSEISIKTKALGLDLTSPFFVSSMTLGHASAGAINHVIASVCEERGLLMGVGSQRRQLEDPNASAECRELRAAFPNLKVMGNLGLSQLIRITTDQVKKLVDSLGAQAMIIHTNPLQECIQPEGTPQFKGGLARLEQLCRELGVPVILKETGCGFSKNTLTKIKDIGLAAVDVSGKGGTHWGRVEAQRLPVGDVRAPAGRSFSEWGLTTAESLLAAREVPVNCEVWASGGVRGGLEGAKLLAMGADLVGFAQPVLAAALEGEAVLHEFFDSLEYELKTALFCTGSAGIQELRRNGVWKWT